MEKFAVVACPKCRQAFGVLLSNKTSKCPRCNKKLTLSRLKIFARTNAHKELFYLVGEVNKELLNVDYE